MHLRSSLFGGLMATLLTTIATAQPAQKAPEQKLQEVTFALASSTLTGGSARVVKEMGLFQNEGIDAKLTVMDSGNATVAALISRSVDFIVCGTGDLITARARGQDVVAVVNVYNGLGSSLVLSKAVADKLGILPTAPVRDRLKALDGLLIGTASPTSVATISLKRSAEAAGANVRFTYLAQSAYAAALESGAIQGHIGGAPFWARPVIKGTGVVWLSDSKGDFPKEFIPTSAGYVGTMRDTVESKRDLTRKVMNAFVELGKATVERPNEVKAAMVRLFPDLDAQTLELLFQSEAPAWKTPPITVQQMVHDIEYVKSTGVAPPEIDKIDPASVMFK